ncbi:flavin reductase family protein [Streptomyces sp. PSKA54]|uniref:Flavin reductase family protein n=1 Tax=Streptomyces himalayensis subsp. aureolus TaxID=2758039 RepID=A0A7W2D8V6_9ACTN|nr:flavin reductase family protein [Streptomyces himalayensis]MBA4866829.1 flavin reductase family protein [Streptomyces himalayensis subsp. aureolus]
MKDDLRSVMRNFATGVCVVSTFSDAESIRRHNALTINSLTSLSLSPPLVSLSIRRDSTFLDDLMGSQVWAISILDGAAEDLARIFARPAEDRRKALHSLPAEPGPQTGALLLDSAAWMECRYRSHLVAGDHLLIVGEVVGAGVNDAGSSLIFLHGKFHRISSIGG